MAEGAAALARRFWPLLVLGCLTLLQGSLVGPQIDFIKATWFARKHSPEVEDCNLTPRLEACKRGLADAAYWGGWLQGSSSLLSVFTSLCLGALSDAVGRRTLLICKACIGVMTASALVSVLDYGSSLWVYLLMAALNNGFDTAGVLLAVMADVTHDQKENRGAIMGSSQVVSLVVAAVVYPLAGKLAATTAAHSALLAAGVRLVFVTTVMPETNTAKATGASGFTFAMARQQLVEAWGIVTRNTFMIRLLAVLTMGGVAAAGKETVMRPYLIAEYGLSKQDLAMLLPVMTPSIILAFTVGLWKGVPRFGEVMVLQMSFAANLLLYFLVILATERWQVFAIYAVLTGPGLMFVPLTNAIKSNLCAAKEQGKVNGLVASVRQLVNGVAAAGFGSLYVVLTDDGLRTEGARDALWLVFGLTSLAAALAWTLPRTYVAAADDARSLGVQLVEPQGVDDEPRTEEGALALAASAVSCGSAKALDQESASTEMELGVISASSRATSWNQDPFAAEAASARS